MAAWGSYIRQEVLAEVQTKGEPGALAYREEQEIDGRKVTLGVERM